MKPLHVDPGLNLFETLNPDGVTVSSIRFDNFVDFAILDLQPDMQADDSPSGHCPQCPRDGVPDVHISKFPHPFSLFQSALLDHEHLEFTLDLNIVPQFIYEFFFSKTFGRRARI